MNTRTTFWLLIIAAGLFGFIVLTEKGQPASQSMAVIGSPLVPNLEATQIKAVEITLSNQFMRLERTAGEWAFTSMRYPAQETMVESFIELASKVPQLGYITAKEVAENAQGAKSFGLEPPRAQVVFNQGNEKIRLDIGARSPIASQIYVRRVGDAGIHLTDAKLLEALPVDQYEWRDPALLDLGGNRFDRVQVRAGTREFHLERRPNTGWAIAKPIEARANTNRVAALLAQLLNARVANFVTDLPTADLEPYALQTPEMEVSFYLSTNRVAGLEFGRSPTNRSDLVYVRRLSHTNIVLADKGIGELLRLNYKTFHDPQLLALNPARVELIEVKAAETFTALRTNGVWHVSNGTNSLRGDNELVQEFLQRVNGLEIVDFIKDVASEADDVGNRLTPPMGRYAFYNIQTNATGLTNALIAELRFGTNTVDKIVVKRTGELPIYETRLGDVNNLPQISWQLRDRQLFQFSSTNLTGMTVEVAGKQQAFARNPLSGWSNDELTNELFSEVLLRLCSARAIRWVARGEAAGKLYMESSNAKITLETPGPDGMPRRVTIRFGGLAPGGNVYAALVLPGDTDETVFVFPGKMYQDLVSNFFAPLAG